MEAGELVKIESIKGDMLRGVTRVDSGFMSTLPSRRS